MTCLVLLLAGDAACHWWHSEICQCQSSTDRGTPWGTDTLGPTHFCFVLIFGAKPQRVWRSNSGCESLARTQTNNNNKNIINWSSNNNIHNHNNNIYIYKYVQCSIFFHKIGWRESLLSQHEWCDQRFRGNSAGKNFCLGGLEKDILPYSDAICKGAGW